MDLPRLPDPVIRESFGREIQRRPLEQLSRTHSVVRRMANSIYLFFNRQNAAAAYPRVILNYPLFSSQKLLHHFNMRGTIFHAVALIQEGHNRRQRLCLFAWTPSSFKWANSYVRSDPRCNDDVKGGGTEAVYATNTISRAKAVFAVRRKRIPRTNFSTLHCTPASEQDRCRRRSESPRCLLKVR